MSTSETPREIDWMRTPECGPTVYKSDEHVGVVLSVVFAHPDDETAVAEIGAKNAFGEIQLADGYDTPTDEDYERRIVAALRPLVEDRRQAAGRAL